MIIFSLSHNVDYIMCLYFLCCTLYEDVTFLGDKVTTSHRCLLRFVILQNLEIRYQPLWRDFYKKEDEGVRGAGEKRWE